MISRIKNDLIVSSNRILYTASDFAKQSLMYLLPTDSFKEWSDSGRPSEENR
ncbi:MAG: hypothetical protein K6F97_06910 [Lachnospiraceae bacterium]|nr:hypothetical protein [Lachnospiraceae bacterium]